MWRIALLDAESVQPGRRGSSSRPDLLPAVVVDAARPAMIAGLSSGVEERFELFNNVSRRLAEAAAHLLCQLRPHERSPRRRPPPHRLRPNAIRRRRVDRLDERQRPCLAHLTRSTSGRAARAMRLASSRGFAILRRDRADRQSRVVDVLAPTSASRPSSSCVQTRLPSRRITRARHGGSSSSPTSSQSPGRGSNVGSSARGPWLIHVSTTRSAPTLVASYHRSYRAVSTVFSLSLVVRVGRSGCRGVLGSVLVPVRTGRGSLQPAAPSSAASRA